MKQQQQAEGKGLQAPGAAGAAPALRPALPRSILAAGAAGRVAAGAGRRWQLPLRGDNPAREIQTPRFLLAFLSSLPTPALPPPAPSALRAPSLPRGSPAAAALSHPPLLLVVLLRAHRSRLLPWRRRAAS